MASKGQLFRRLLQVVESLAHEVKLDPIVQNHAQAVLLPPRPPPIVSEKPEHDMFAGAFAKGTAKKSGVALVHGIDDAVVVYGLTTFADVLPTDGTNKDFIRDGLTACRTKFHAGLLHSERAGTAQQ
jgi:hypothetical protein